MKSKILDAKNILNRKQASVNKLNGISSSKLAFKDAHSIISPDNKHKHLRNQRSDARTKIQPPVVYVNRNQRGVVYDRPAPKYTVRNTYATDSSRVKRGLSKQSLDGVEGKCLINGNYKKDLSAFHELPSMRERKMKGEIKDYVMNINIKNDKIDKAIKKRSIYLHNDNYKTKMKYSRKSNRADPHKSNPRK